MRTGRTARWLGVLILVGAAAPARAQSDADLWKFTITPYMVGFGLTGTVGVGNAEAIVDSSFADLLSHLDSGFMGIFAVRKGNWGFGADAIYTAMNTTSQVPLAGVHVNQTLLAGYGTRQLAPYAELTFGARLNHFTTGIALGERTISNVDGDQTWLDPLVGLNLRLRSKRRVSVAAFTEVGGFGVASTLAWQVFPTVSVRVTPRMAIDAGYRWLRTDYESEDLGGFKMDTVVQGPTIGLAFRF